jgi:hypothetical protein
VGLVTHAARFFAEIGYNLMQRGQPSMQRGARAIRNREPNWKLAFGSGSFLLVWLLGVVSSLPLDLVLFRSVIAAGLGSCLGAVVGMTLRGVLNLAKEPEKGRRVDYTVPVGTDELDLASAPDLPSEASKVVPAASPQDVFQPIDFKQAAKHVQGLVKE